MTYVSHFSLPCSCFSGLVFLSFALSSLFMFSSHLYFFFCALEINVAQKLRFDCRGARCQRRRQRQRQRLMVLVSCLRLWLTVDSTGSGSGNGSRSCARCSAACRVCATRGTETSTDATNSQAYKSHTRHKRSM